MGVILSVRDVRRGFLMGGETFWALRGISLDVEENKLTVFKGRSGSGKTTLMNILGALDYPTSGRVEFAGKPISEASERTRNIVRRDEMGFVFQSVALVSMLSAYENVELMLRISRYPKSERRKRAEYCLEKVGLGGRMSHFPPELSGGEQQRVAIARAIAPRPKVVFADEPTAELDSNTGLQVIKIFGELIRDEGATVVMSTHDPGLMELADRVYELVDGEVAGGA